MPTIYNVRISPVTAGRVGSWEVKKSFDSLRDNIRPEPGDSIRIETVDGARTTYYGQIALVEAVVNATETGIGVSLDSSLVSNFVKEDLKNRKGIEFS